MYNGCLD